MPTASMTMSVPKGFDLASAVCSHGYFILAPNRWVPQTRTLHRPLHGRRDRIVQVAVRQPRRGGPLRVSVSHRPTAEERGVIRAGVARMLRLDEPEEVFRAFHRLCPAARRARFARLFRSPSLFEDLVKTMTGCNTTWPSTMRMNVLLCEHVGGGAFPLPSQLASWTPQRLAEQCKVGYRAERILRLARRVNDGELDLTRFADSARPTDDVFEDLKSIYGIGDYAAGNMCQLLGRYDRLAIDSETYRHFRQVHGVATPENPRHLHDRIERHYRAFAPFQFLIYWFELWTGYQHRAGHATSWIAEKHGPTFTAAKMK